MESVISEELQLVETKVVKPKAEKKVTSNKKAKKVYEPVKTMICDRCGQFTEHTLFNYDTRAYKCNICGTI